LSQREGKKKGKNGKGREGKGKKGKKRKEKGREKKGREGKGREGKGRMGRERKGKEGKAHYLSVYLIEHHKGPGQTLQFSAISAKMISRGTQKKERKKEGRGKKEERRTLCRRRIPNTHVQKSIIRSGAPSPHSDKPSYINIMMIMRMMKMMMMVMMMMIMMMIIMTMVMM